MEDHKDLPFFMYIISNYLHMKFDWMVIDHIDKTGIYFKSTMKGIKYVFFFNPIKMISRWLTGGIYIGLPPLHIKHIKNL